MRIALTAWVITAALTGLVAAQSTTPAAFEVASIKPDESGGNIIESKPGYLTARSATPATCIMWAYGVQSSQISGANPAVSSLLQSDRYSILAKAAGPVPDPQLRIMLQTLLAERFKLALHRQNKEMQVLVLVVDKTGPKLHPADGDGESKEQPTSKLSRRWLSTSMAQLATSLGEAMRAPVQDQTGLSGKYDFAVDLTPYLPANGERPDIAGMMVTAVREQLGLRLESRRAVSEVLVIDNLEKPTAN